MSHINVPGAGEDRVTVKVKPGYSINDENNMVHEDGAVVSIPMSVYKRQHWRCNIIEEAKPVAKEKEPDNIPADLGSDVIRNRAIKRASRK